MYEHLQHQISFIRFIIDNIFLLCTLEVVDISTFFCRLDQTEFFLFRTKLELELIWNVGCTCFFLCRLGVTGALSKLESSLKHMDNYLTANEPEHRVAHIPPIVAPGPANQTNVHELRH
jgi:hypothetical protein